MSGIPLPETQVETISEREREKKSMSVFFKGRKKRAVWNETMEHK